MLLPKIEIKDFFCALVKTSTKTDLSRFNTGEMRGCDSSLSQIFWGLQKCRGLLWSEYRNIR